MTFVGSGEPLMYAGMGWLTQPVKGMTDLPVAVTTNGSLLYLAQVRPPQTTAAADLPSLEAGTAELYRQINRPDRK